MVWSQVSGSLVWMQGGCSRITSSIRSKNISDRSACPGRAARQRGALPDHRRGHSGMDLGNRFARRHLYLLEPGGGRRSSAVKPARSDDRPRTVSIFVAPNTRAHGGRFIAAGSSADEAWLARSGAAFEACQAGGIRWLDNNALPLTFDAEGNVIGYRGVARDITQRRLQQERIARLSRIQAVLSAINSTIVRVRDRRELLREACRICRSSRAASSMAWIGRWSNRATMKASPLWCGKVSTQGYLDRDCARNSPIKSKRTPGPVGKAHAPKKDGRGERHRGRPEYQLFKREALARGFRSQMAMPLVVDNEALGVSGAVCRRARLLRLRGTEAAQGSGRRHFLRARLHRQGRAPHLRLVLRHVDGAARTASCSSTASHKAMQRGARGSKRDLAVMLIDLLNASSRINDTLGRLRRRPGAERTRRIGCRRTISESATPARIGGDRFALVVPNLPGTDVGALGGGMDRRCLSPSLSPIDDIELRTSVKIGIALFPADADTAEVLVHERRGGALKRAKDGPATVICSIRPR